MSYNKEKMEVKELGKNQNFQKFIGVLPVTKTLRNELIPTETTKKNKNNKIRGVLPGQNSFLIFIGIYRYYPYQGNKIIKTINLL